MHDFLTVFRSDTLTCLSLFQVTDYLSAKALTSEAISGPTYQVPLLFYFNYSNFNVSWCSVIGILPTVLAITVSSKKTVSSKVTCVSGTKVLERLRSVQFAFRFVLFSWDIWFVSSTGQTYPEGRSTNRTQVLCEVLHPTLSRKTREIDHNTGNYVPYSFRWVCGFFNVPC